MRRFFAHFFGALFCSVARDVANAECEVPSCGWRDKAKVKLGPSLGDVGSNPQAMERLADLYPFCHKIGRHLEALC